MGDFTQDSNPLLSSWVISDLSGGHGVEDMNESLDVARYRLGTFYTRFPKQISKPYKVSWISNAAWPATGQAWVFGDLFAANAWQTIVGISDWVTGTEVYSLSDPGTLIGTFDNNNIPVAPPVLYQGQMVIPTGDGVGGYVHIAADLTLTNVPFDGTHPILIHAIQWDNKIVGIDQDGALWYTIDPSPTGDWVPYNITAATSGDFFGYRLVGYFDRNGMATVFILTETEVLQFDASGPEIGNVDVWYPFHPDNYQAAAKFGGDLYFAINNGVMRYTGGSLSAMGLDSDAGLPAPYSGPILNLVPGLNGMYATVQRPDADGAISLHEYTGAGWHMLWEQNGGAPLVRDGAAISRGGDNYRLYWTIGDVSEQPLILYIDLPRQYANPRQRSTASGGFASTDDMTIWLDTGIFDAQMLGYKKVANAIDLNIETIATGAELFVQYKIDNADTWTDLGSATTAGRTTLPFGTLTAGIYPGELFERIQFRFNLVDESNDAFILNSAVLSFIKLMPSSESWTLELNLTDNGPGGDSPQTMIDKLDTILENGLFVPMVHRGETFRVFLSQLSGSSETGIDEGAFRRVSVLEVPQTLGNA